AGVRANDAEEQRVEGLAPDDPMSALLQKVHGDYPAQEEATEKLIALGGKAVASLVLLCSDTSEDMRWHAVDLLGSIGDPRALDPLVGRVLADQDVHVRWRSIWAIGSMDAAAVGAKLVAALKSEDSRTQWNAA